MRIEVHRANGINLKMFLDTLGFVSVWNKINEDFDELQVLPDDRTDLLGAIKAELDKTGFLPYHYLLTPQDKGLQFYGKEVELEAVPTQMVDLTNISGKFRLILLEDGRNNYLWKTYSEREFAPNQLYKAKAKVSCTLQGRNGENFILINNPKWKK